MNTIGIRDRLAGLVQYCNPFASRNPKRPPIWILIGAACSFHPIGAYTVLGEVGGSSVSSTKNRLYAPREVAWSAARIMFTTRSVSGLGSDKLSTVMPRRHSVENTIFRTLQPAPMDRNFAMLSAKAS